MSTTSQEGGGATSGTQPLMITVPVNIPLPERMVFGARDTDEEALEDHDRNLQEVFNSCRQKGIKLNSEKIQFRQKQVSYMGHIISSEGLRADPNKLKAIDEMPPPTDKEGVQRVLGI